MHKTVGFKIHDGNCICAGVCSQMDLKKPQTLFEVFERKEKDSIDFVEYMLQFLEQSQIWVKNM